MNKPQFKPKYDKPYEVKPNSGSLRKTLTKKNNDSPDYYGSFKLDLSTLEVDGKYVEFKLSGWKSVDTKGQSFLSLKVNLWKPEQEQEQPRQAAKAEPEGDDDDIPF